jgi:NitT/TauT family transport system substrate-binding protein
VPSDGLLLLLTGEVDVLASAPNAGALNAASQGLVRIVAPMMYPAPESQTGLWVRNEMAGGDGDEFDFAELEGARIGSATGAGSPTSVPIAEALEAEGLTLADVEFVQLGVADTLVALENGSVDAAWLLDPFWLEVVDADHSQFVLPPAPDLALATYFFGPNLLEDSPEVGEAFVRALMRTTRTYLQGDYKADQEVLNALSEIMEVPEESLQQTPPGVFDPDLTLEDSVAERFEATYLSVDGLLEYDEPRGADQIIDDRFVRAAQSQ